MAPPAFARYVEDMRDTDSGTGGLGLAAIAFVLIAYTIGEFKKSTSAGTKALVISVASAVVITIFPGIGAVIGGILFILFAIGMYKSFG